jgi:hypothetical protein
MLKKSLIPLSFRPFLLLACNKNETLYKVVGIKDGDTMVCCLSPDNQSITVRLAEVDCPEKSQAFGQAAKAVYIRSVLRQNGKAYWQPARPIRPYGRGGYTGEWYQRKPRVVSKATPGNTVPIQKVWNWPCWSSRPGKTAWACGRMPTQPRPGTLERKRKHNG